MAYIDLSGLLLTQSNYLNAINTGNADDNGKLTDIQTKLTQLNNDYNKANISSAQILTHQDMVNNIITQEKNRLQLKQEEINLELEGKKRGILMNDSYRKRYQEYTKITIIIVVSLLLCIGLAFLGKTFPFLPSGILTLLCAIIIFIALLLCYFIYYDILSRDRVNFDELNLGNPSLLSPNDIARKQQVAGKQGNLLSSINLGYCVGAACCSDASGTVWDSTQSMCVVKPAFLSMTPTMPTSIAGSAISTTMSTPTMPTAMAGSAISTTSSMGSTILGTTVPGSTIPESIAQFTTIKQAYHNGDLLVSPNSPHEFNKYSKIG
jgi:hypothetical protein